MVFTDEGFVVLLLIILCLRPLSAICVHLVIGQDVLTEMQKHLVQLATGSSKTPIVGVGVTSFALQQ